jgi:hypothetical protein
MTKVELVAEMGNLQCWRLAKPMLCSHLDITEVRFCPSSADFIVQHRNDDAFVMPLCRQHLPEWAKRALKDDESGEVNDGDAPNNSGHC